MKFLCLCRFDAQQFAAMPPEQMAKIPELCAPHDERFKASGHVAMVGSLSHETKVIRAIDGRAVVGDGPFEPSPMPVGAFFILHADDEAKALEIAQMHPGVALASMFGGGIEIFAIEHVEQPGA